MEQMDSKTGHTSSVNSRVLSREELLTLGNGQGRAPLVSKNV